MYNTEIEMLEKILDKNLFYGRLGKTFKTRDKFFFYDLGTGKIFECSNSEYVILEKILCSKSVHDILKLDRNILDNSLSNLVSVILKENLLQAPPLEFFAGDQTLNLEGNLKSELKQIIFEVTERCNLRCDYCIYGEGNSKFRDFSSMRDMSLDTALKSLEKIKDRISDEFYVTFYGGEPLLNFSLIKEIVQYVLSLNLDTEFHFSITTNLTLMTREIADFIASIDNFAVVCSIDGDEATHDEHRKSIKGKGSFNKAMMGLRYLYQSLSKKGKEDHILLSTVITPPYSEEKLNRIQDFFEHCPYIDEKTSIITSYVDYGKKIQNEDLKHRQGYQNYESFMHDNNPVQLWAETFFNEKEAKNPFTWNGILQNLQRIHSRRISGTPMKEYILNGCCTPGGRKLFVTVDGNFNVCERMGKTPLIGNFEEGYDIDRIKKYYVDDYCNTSQKDCKNCWAIHLCSICYAVCYDEKGINPLTKKYKCISERFGIENYLKLYHEIMEFKPSVLKDLNKMKLS